MKEHLTLAVRTLAVLSCLVLGLVIGPARQAGAAPDPPTRSYYAYVCSESEDEVALVRYGPSGLEVYKQGREIAMFVPFDAKGFIANAPFVWGPQPYKGNIFFTDWNTGLWAVQLEAKERPGRIVGEPQ